MTASDIVVCHRCRLLHCESSFPWSWPPFFFSPVTHFNFTGKTSIDCFEDVFDSMAEIIVGKTKTKQGRRWRSWIHIIVFCYIKYSNMWWQPTQNEKSESLQFCVGERVFVARVWWVETKMFIKHAVKHPNYSEQKLITDACIDFMAQKSCRLWLSTKVLVHKCHLYNVCRFFFFFFDMDDVGTPLN